MAFFDTPEDQVTMFVELDPYADNIIVHKEGNEKQ